MRLQALRTLSLIAFSVSGLLACGASAENPPPATPVVETSAVSAPAAADSSKPKGQQKKYTAILVDKATNQLHLTDLQGGEYKLIKTFHTTLGKVKGDKMQEDDQKTPEGIYTFNAKLKPPAIKKKFGAMAFYINYPNTYDQIAGRTGFDIMLHATDEPDRLKLNYDSEGCIVLKDEEISEVEPYVRVGLTPILIFPELKSEFWKPGKDPVIRGFFEKWISAWEGKDIESYIDAYHTDFSAQGKDRDAWKSYKNSLNRQYSEIKIGPEDVLYYRHPKYWMITFTQNYQSKRKGGGWGHRSRGTKILYVAEEAGKPKIIAETYTQLMW